MDGSMTVMTANEQTAVSLVRKALAMIDDAGQGDSTFAIHLSHALDVVNGHAGIEHDMANAWSADGSITVEQARHQLRNMLTIVSALVNQSLDGDEPTIASAREAASRIAMLTRISDLLLQPQTQLNDLHTLVSLALTEGGTGRIRISGPICPIGSAHAATLALALHELEVHALHNGALSTRDGYVEVSWMLTTPDDPYLWLQWAECNGPATMPLDDGFGRRLLTTATPRRLHGEATLDELPTGLVWSLHAPVTALRG
jgi:two-component sensor histidine kinase